MLNPVLRREAQTSLRNWKIYAGICAYVAIIASVAALFVWGQMRSSLYGGFDPRDIIILYGLLAGFQMGLILITVPALTAGSINGERERQTLDLLLITKMSPFSIVFGKLIASLAIVILMVLATMPVFAVLFYFGGLNFFLLLQMTFFLLIVALMIGSISVFFSAIFKKTMVSIVLVYLIIGMLCGGTIIGFLLYNSIYWRIIEDYPGFYSIISFFIVNPAVGFFSLIDKQIGTSVVDELFYIYRYMSSNTQLSSYQTTIVTHFWLINIIFNIIITVLFTFFASKMLYQAKKR